MTSIDETGNFVQMSMDELKLSDNNDDKEAHNNIVSTVANFSLAAVRLLCVFPRFVQSAMVGRLRQMNCLPFYHWTCAQCIRETSPLACNSRDFG